MNKISVLTEKEENFDYIVSHVLTNERVWLEKLLDIVGADSDSDAIIRDRLEEIRCFHENLPDYAELEFENVTLCGHAANKHYRAELAAVVLRGREITRDIPIITSTKLFLINEEPAEVDSSNAEAKPQV